jgi:hypothetical protein
MVGPLALLAPGAGAEAPVGAGGAPRLSTCGQCAHVLANCGFVTPSTSPAMGGPRPVSDGASLSWMVKYGRKSVASGTCVAGLLVVFLKWSIAYLHVNGWVAQLHDGTVCTKVR